MITILVLNNISETLCYILTDNFNLYSNGMSDLYIGFLYVRVYVVLHVLVSIVVINIIVFRSSLGLQVVVILPICLITCKYVNSLLFRYFYLHVIGVCFIITCSLRFSPILKY